MDKKRSILNVSVSIGFKVVILFVSLLNKRMLIQYLGNSVNGLNSLFFSILGFLSVAELGVGSAITYCMYEPIVEKNYKKVSALYNLFRKIYFIIGLLIFCCGLLLTPFLSYFVADYEAINNNIYLSFVLMLISVVLTYFYGSKSSLINAHKNNYVTTTINSLSLILRDVIQIVSLVIFKSFIIYICVRIVLVIVEWCVTELYVRRKYKNLITTKEKIDVETKRSVSKNVKAMFAHKIGSVFVNTADSIIISAFIGVVVLGGYSNYTTIMSSVIMIMLLFFSPLTSVIGHMCTEQSVTIQRKYFNFFYGCNFFLGTVFLLGYYAVIDNIVTICFGSNLELPKTISFVITLNQFIQFIRQATLTFRDATGTFYYDRWKPVAEGIFNVILSVVFVIVFPKEYKVVGVIVATIITNLLICHIIEPFVLFKYAFKQSFAKFVVKNYRNIIIFIVGLIFMSLLSKDMENQFVEFIINGCISIVISLGLCLFVALVDKEFKQDFVLKSLTLIKEKILTRNIL